METIQLTALVLIAVATTFAVPAVAGIIFEAITGKAMVEQAFAGYCVRWCAGCGRCR